MRKLNYILFGVPIVFFALTFMASAFGAEYEVEMTENGFNQSSLSISDGDVVTFVNTHMKANGNLEPHAISDPFAIPYTEASFWILDNNYQSQSYTLDCSGHVFYDRFIIPSPSIEISCGENQTTNNTEEDTDTYDLTSLQSELMGLTADFTAAVETIALLQQEVVGLEAEITVLEAQEFDTTPYENQITSLESQVSDLTLEKLEAEIDRDIWQTLSDGWYAVAMEQLRIMVDVLGL
jgi:hypothetical protein